MAGAVHKIIPVGERELAKIVHNKLTEKDVSLENLRARMHGRPDRVIPPGTYVGLHTRSSRDNGWVIMMSDTPYELMSALDFKIFANGHVLILGLGLGATTIPVLAKPSVSKVTVIERNLDVIELVKPNLYAVEGGSKLEVVWADAFKWRPPKDAKYDTIWMDIWPTISGDNLPEITKLKRRYGKHLNRENEHHWLGVWEEGYLRREARKDREISRMMYGSVGGRDPRNPPLTDHVTIDGKRVEI